jgi:transcriptional regulator with XRE-family HTH domain
VANLHLGPKHVAQLGAYIREQRESAQYSLRQLALAAGVSNPYLSQIERGLRKPSAEILQQLAKALQISAETLYMRAGLLDEQTGADDGAQGAPFSATAARTAVLIAIAADPGLDPHQKLLLRDIYESFRSGRPQERGDAVPESDPNLNLNLSPNRNSNPTSTPPPTTPEVNET